MKTAQGKGMLERGAASDLWRNTLSQIPSVFGRLTYLSALREPNTGVYEHHGLALLFGEEEANKALRRSHEDSFLAWLGFSLEQQKADLDLYISSLPGNRRQIIDIWQRLTPYRNVVPVSVRDAERRLFVADFEALVKILKAEHAVADPDPDA